MCGYRWRQSGFTMIELVVVILLLGILSVFVMPRFVDFDTFRSRAAYDEVAGAVRYAQKLAVASGCEVQFAVSGNRYVLRQHSSGCSSGPFADLTGFPVNGGTVSGVSFSASPASFIFDAMGRSSSAATITLGDKNFSVIAETGYVDAP
ncbi:MAG: prepilin-type N-terminal cleavage/methylation domain-containing protein [Deltaproteobacteria bacterium]|nr:prepilin-type N-terminal cleavage/methylation domain-containing protein [Deltaproteobacteria bacterium]